MYTISFFRTLSRLFPLIHSLTPSLIHFPFLCFLSLLFSYQQFSMALSRTMGNKSFIAIWCMHSLDYICYINKFNRMFSQTMMLFIYQLASCKWNQPVYFGLQRENKRERKKVVCFSLVEMFYSNERRRFNSQQC